MKADELFLRASECWDRGELKSAFRLFLKAAKAGDSGAQVDLGFFYDTGVAVKANRDSALYWYRRAYRQRSGAAAANIGTVWRDEGKLDRALSWFHRAVKLGDADANLEIAKLLLRKSRDSQRAITYLKRTIMAGKNHGTEASKTEARRF